MGREFRTVGQGAGLRRAPVSGGGRAGFIGSALPMGPFELLDVVGPNVSPAIERSLYSEFRESGLTPVPLLEHLVAAGRNELPVGRLGRTTGPGFRDYAAR